MMLTTLFRRSLKTKITVITLLVFLVSLWSLTFYVGQMLRKDTEHLLGEQQFSIASMVADQINRELERRLEALKAVAVMAAGPMQEGPQSTQRFLEQRPDLRTLFSGGIFTVAPDGSRTAYDPFEPYRFGVNLLDRDYIAGPIKEGKPTIGRPIIGRTEKSPVVVMAVPVTDAKGKVIGALAGSTILSKLNFIDQITASPYGETGGYLLIAPQHGLFVAATEKDRVMQAIPPRGANPLLDRFVDGYEGYGVAKNAHGIDELSAARSIPVTGWILAILQPCTEAFAPISNMLHRVLLATLVLTLVVGGLMWWILRRALLPLSATADILKNTSIQDAPPRPLAIDRDDEIGELVAGFNHLIETLGAREEALRLSKDRYQQLFEEIPVGYHEYDTEGKITRVNRTELQTLGYSETEMLGHYAWEFVEDSECSQQRIFSKLAGNNNPDASFERSYRRKDGELVPGILQDKLLFDADGKVSGVRSIVMYTIERKLAEEALRISEKRYRTTVQTSVDSINITRLRDGLYIDVNEGFIRTIGYSRDELIGHSANELGIWVDPADRVQLSEILKLDSACSNFEARFRKKNGDILWGSMTARVIELDNEICLISVTRDVTSIKATQEELRQHRNHLEQLVAERTEKIREKDARLADAQFAMDNAGIGIHWVEVPSGRIHYMNKFSREMLGYSEEEALNLCVPDFNPTFSPDSFARTCAHFLQQERIQLESIERTKDGRDIPVEVIINRLPDHIHSPAQIIAFVRDITPRKEFERELIEAKEFAEAANLAKSTFLANMSHEIRTPLNGIIGMTHILKRGSLSPAQADRLNKIDTSAEHLLAIINDILDLSKIEAGKVQLESCPVDINRLLADTRSIMSTRAQARKLDFEVEPASFTGALQGDPTRLQQALLNYVGNAIKFTEVGSVTLRALVQEESNDSVSLRFEVQDTGIGIDPDVVSRLFTPFEQADNSTTRKYGGTGLGLAITRRLAELMGGNTGVTTTLGVGSTFWFTARLQKMNRVNDTSEPLPAGDAEPLIRTRHHGRQLLLVDDEPFNLEVAKTFLEDAGLIVDIAEDGRQAVEKARQNDYALILMDIQMPNLNGIEATQQIRELPHCRNTPVLAMTANAFSETKTPCLEAGINDFIIKPFIPDVLFSTVLKWLERI